MVDFIPSAGCERVERLSPPIEFMIEPQDVNVLGWYRRKHEFDDDWEKALIEAIQRYGDEKYVGIHNTTVGSARDIASEGFSGSSARTVSPEGIRGGAVFTWHYWADESRFLDLEFSDDSATVIVTADRDSVYVGEMDSSSYLLKEQISIGEYQDEYLVHYPVFLHCVKNSSIPAEGYGTEAMFHKDG
jgi:hypothetical protein